MKNIFSIIKASFVKEGEKLYYSQERAKRVAILSAYIAKEIFIVRALRMSLQEFYNTALLYCIDKNKGIKIAKEKGIEISEVQKEILKRETFSLEADIIRLAQNIIKMSGKEFEILIADLRKDEANQEVLNLIGDAKLRYWYDFEDLISANWEVTIFPIK